MKTIFLTILLSINIFGQCEFMLLLNGEATTPAILSDGNTVGWYDMTTVTKNANNKVTSWTDLSGNDNHFVQADTSKAPTLTATAVEFDGVNDYMFALDSIFQPLTYYLVVNLNVYTLAAYMIDGIDVNAGIYQDQVNSSIRLNPGSIGGHNYDLTLNEYSVITVVMNGASSLLQVDDSTAVTASGTNNPGGVTLASKQNFAAYSKMDVKEMILRKVADSEANRTAIKSYLNNKYSVY